MANYEDKTGGDVLALAHNGNLSNGIMFPVTESYQGKRVDREICSHPAPGGSRSTRSPRIKGDGETHPFLSPMTSSPTTSSGTKAICLSPP